MKHSLTRGENEFFLDYMESLKVIPACYWILGVRFRVRLVPFKALIELTETQLVCVVYTVWTE